MCYDNVVETYELEDNKELRILRDDNSEDPREWDQLGKMVCFHSRFNLGDKHEFNSEDFHSWDEMKTQIEKEHDVAVILPLYLYNHSGITMKTTPFSCPWDSGQVGWIYADKKSIRQNYGVLKVTKKTIERVKKCLLAEVDEYDHYITGEVYGFSIVEKDKDGEEGELIESCWGFYGSNWKKNGLFDHLDESTRTQFEAQL